MQKLFFKDFQGHLLLSKQVEIFQQHRESTHVGNVNSILAEYFPVTQVYEIA